MNQRKFSWGAQFRRIVAIMETISKVWKLSMTFSARYWCKKKRKRRKRGAKINPPNTHNPTRPSNSSQTWFLTMAPNSMTIKKSVRLQSPTYWKTKFWHRPYSRSWKQCLKGKKNRPRGQRASWCNYASLKTKSHNWRKPSPHLARSPKHKNQTRWLTLTS